MGIRQGTLLEKQVSKLFISHGLKAERNVRVNGYEIDVFVKRGKQKIAIECKQYERAEISIRNLIHQWSSKKNEIGADIILLVIYGQQIAQTERQLARKLGVLIWDESDLDKIETMANEKFYKILNLDSNVSYNSSNSPNRDLAINFVLIMVGIGLTPFLIGIPLLILGIYRLAKSKKN